MVLQCEMHHVAEKRKGTVGTLEMIFIVGFVRFG